MKQIKKDIDNVKDQIIDAVLAKQGVNKLREELEGLMQVGSAQDVLVHQVVKHFENQVPTEDELHLKIEDLLDNAPEAFLEYRKEVYNKVRSRVQFSIPLKNLKRGECYYG